MKSKDIIIGNRYGDWLVLAIWDDNKKSTLKFTCVCSCGNVVGVSRGSLLYRISTKCRSCAARTPHKPHCGKNLKGKVFGYLTAISRTKKPPYSNYFWECVCICGKRTVVRGYFLTTGHTKSCGCLQKLKRRSALKYHKPRELYRVPS
jgi:hypothetical protein